MAAGVEEALAIVSGLALWEQAGLVVDDSLLRFCDVRHEPDSQLAHQVNLTKRRQDCHPFAERLCRAHLEMLEIANGPVASQTCDGKSGLAT